jgi:RHS repeat-associated protein
MFRIKRFLKKHLNRKITYRPQHRCLEMENATAINQAHAAVVTNDFNYDAWGLSIETLFNPTYSSTFGSFNSPNPQRHRYNSKEQISSSRFYDYGARQYDPVIGRWLSVDPLADHPNQIGISPYAFLNNNPVNNIDPDGRLPIPLITGAIGAAGGLIYGLVKGKSWKETAALTAGGFVAGATLGFGTAGIAALGGIEAIGGAGATMITLGSGVAGGMIGNAVEQGVKVSLGESSSFSGNEVVLNGAFGMSEVVLGPAGKAVEGAAKNAVQDGLSQMFKPASRAEIRSTQRELASQIRASALPGTISKSEAKSAAKQLVTAAQQQRANTLKGTIRILNGAVDVSVSAMQTTVSEETKNKLNNQ